MCQPSSIKFTSLTSKDGLLSNAVNAILKDRYGFMWFATDDGLNKFDGTNFTVYRHIQGDSSSLWANEILALHEDATGGLWVGTSGGSVSLYDRKKDRFIHFPLRGDRSGLIPNAVVRSICSDHEGNIWIAQYESPYKIDPVTHTITKVPLPSPAISNGMSLYCILCDHQGRIWVGTDNGLYLYQLAGRSFIRVATSGPNSQGLPDELVRTLAEDNSGRLWIGTGAGLCSMNAGDGSIIRYRTGDAADSVLSGQPINAIVADKDQKLWIATLQGLYITDPRNGRTVSFLPGTGNVHGLTSRSVKSLFIDKEGIYWLGTYRGGINKYDKNLNLFDWKLSDGFFDGGARTSIVNCFAEQKNGPVWVGTDGAGLYTFDRRSDSLRRFRLAGQESASSILSLERVRDGRLYIGTQAAGLIILDPVNGRTRRLKKGRGEGELNSNEIHVIHEDRMGNSWLGTNGQGLTVLRGDRIIRNFTPEPVKQHDIHFPINGYIRAIEEDTDGNIWIGTHGGGLAVYHPGSGEFTIYNQQNSRLPVDKIYSLHCDGRGRMWVGTYGGGLSMFDKAAGGFINYGEKDGLQNTTIYKVLEDEHGQLWLSTNTGISGFDPQTGKFRNFTAYNGLQHNNFVHGSGIRLSDGTLIFGGLQGFNYFNPAALTVNRNLPVVVLTDLQIANRSVEPGEKAPIREQISVASDITVGYRQNFAISFVGLSYTLPGQNQYAYKLGGFDRDWNYIGTAHTATYTNLDPGHYVFHVKASNNDGIWSISDKTIRIYVKPPVWRTIYAYLFYVAVIVGLLFYSRYRGITRIRRKFQREREQAEMLKVREIDRMRLKFLTNLSHEFRTPISLIIGPVDQLMGEQQDPAAKQKLAMISRNARRLLNLVNQVLDFRKMEDQELRLHVTAGELVSFVSDVVGSFSDLSARKKIGLTFHSELTKAYVLFDQDKLERILFNLLSNAFKFTLEGGQVKVTLTSGAEPSEAAVRWVVIDVEDTGVGIPAGQQQLIFERFYQHTVGSAVLNQGTGIGLSITKEFVRLHGGTIDVRSEEGVGTVFSVHLPLAAAEVIPAGPGGVDAQLAEGSGKEPVGGKLPPVVLLVEDNEDFRTYLKDGLAAYRVVEAGNGREGWQKALSAHPQLIVSDISMPFMDGITLSRKLKSDRRTSHIPIILLTAVTGDAGMIAGLETGANDYITKPFNPEVLDYKIRNLLQLGQDLKNTYTKQIKLLEPELQLETADERLLQNIVRTLEANITDPRLSVEFLSKEVGMSRSSLYSKMLELTGETPVEFIRSFKLGKAAVLLESTGLTVAEVAYQTGFTTPNYFAKAFKAKFNILPSEYLAQKRRAKQEGNSQPD